MVKSVKIGSQEIIPEVKDLGDKILLKFKVQVKEYKGKGNRHESYPATIDVEYVCNKYKTVFEGRYPNIIEKKVEKDLQECVNEWANLMKDLYEFV